VKRRFDTVAIFGVGLIGGSIGLGLLRRGLADRVIGIGRRSESLRLAEERGAVTSTTLVPEAGIAEADMVVVCTPVGRIVDDVRSLAAHCRAGTLITDVGSTKHAIVTRLRGCLTAGVTFIGSHPLAGSEQSGPAAADGNLFVDRVVVVTPDDGTPAGELDALCDFWRGLGARVVEMPADEHDRALAATSHLPHLAAAALAAATPPDLLGLTAGGWADGTRVASGDAELWRQIFAENRGPLLASLARLEEQLAEFRSALERGDGDAVLRLLAAAKKIRDSIV
jgi:prephenate dehydrogenase